MNPVSLIVVFDVLWWLIFFMALPVGISAAAPSNEGNFNGSPKKHNLKIKAFVTTIIAAILTVLYFVAMESGWFDFVQMRGYYE